MSESPRPLLTIAEVQIRMAAVVDWNGLLALHAAWAGHPKFDDSRKHTSVENLVRMSELAFLLGLATEAPGRTLDLGTGFGWLPLALRCLGHDAWSVNRPAEDMEAGAACLGITPRILKIEARTPLPAELTGFRFISLMNVNLRNREKAYFTPADYAFFLGDLLTRLEPDGTILVRLNRYHDPDYRILLDEFWHTACADLDLTFVRQQNKKDLVFTRLSEMTELSAGPRT